MRSLLFFIFVFASFSVVAAPDNSNGEKFEFLHAEIMDLRDAVTDLTVDSATTSQSIESLESDVEDLSDQLNDLQSQIDSMNTGSDMGDTEVLVGYVPVNDETCSVNENDIAICYLQQLLSLCLNEFGAESFPISYQGFIRGYGAHQLEFEEFGVIFGSDSEGGLWSMGNNTFYSSVVSRVQITVPGGSPVPGGYKMACAI